jgi:RND family efflux transporter MFP subunit
MKPFSSLLALAVVPALGLAGCGAADAGADRAAAEPKEVRVVTTEIRPIERLISAVGTLAAQEQSTLSSKVAGRLQGFEVDLGSEVRRGQVLARIEPRDYELRVQQAAAALAQARAELGLPPAPPEGASEPALEVDDLSTVRHARAVLDEAIKNRERVRSLADSGIASTADLDTVEARYTVALTSYETAREEGRVRVATLEQRQAELEIARKNLADTVVTAPFDGAVQERPAAVGQYVAAGTPVVTVVQSDPLRLRLEVPEREAILLRERQPVRLRVDGDENVYHGEIARLSPALDERTRTLRVEADVPRTGSLRAGLFARADIVVAADDRVLCVPANAITSFAGIEKVILVRDGKAEERVVRTGRRTPECVEILEGLEPGLTAILDPGGLQTGQPVRVAGGAGLPTATGGATNG